MLSLVPIPTQVSKKSVPSKALLLSQLHPLHSPLCSSCSTGASPVKTSDLHLTKPNRDSGVLFLPDLSVALMRLIIYSFKYFLFTGSCDVTFTAFSFYFLLFPANSIHLLNLHLLSFSLAEPLPSCVVGSCLYVMPFILSPLGLKVKKNNNIGLGIILTSVTVSVLPLNVNYVF